MIAVLEPTLPVHAERPVAAGRWMQVLSHLDPKYGGISTVVPSLVRALSEQQVDSSIEAFCTEGEEYRPAAIAAGVTHFWPLSRRRWLADSELRKGLEEELRRHDGVHVHGLWDVTSAVASRAARRWNKPYLVSSHGMLEPWALSHGKWKKRIYSALIEKGTIRNARCLHALTQAEANQYRRYAGSHVPMVVIPNGVTVPESLSAAAFLGAHPELQGRRVVLFLSRLHVKKGVDLLVRAWKQVVAKVPDAVLVLAGPDAESMSSALREMVQADGTEDSIVFAGMLGPEMKWSALAAAECMVLPSHSEGLSMSVLEAMGAGVPVLVTPQCNMPWIATTGTGWLTEPATGAIEEALIHILSRTREANAQAGALARDFVRQSYSWSSVAERMAEVYQWCLGGDEPTLSEVIR